MRMEKTTLIDKPVRHGMRWGNWVFNRKSLVLQFAPSSSPTLDWWNWEVDLEECRTSAQVLDWLCESQGKNGISNMDIGDLLEAIDYLANGLQGLMCSFGVERSDGASWASKLRPLKANKRYGPRGATIRARVIARDGCCQKCGQTWGLAVHHRKALSEFKGDVQSANHDTNLITLCASCHRNLHKCERARSKSGLCQ